MKCDELRAERAHLADTCAVIRAQLAMAEAEVAGRGAKLTGVSREMLGKNASPHMRAIVETIQRDQDMAIRDTDRALLMVQGAAGSGKTSVALHRVAYLMYAELRAPLDAESILILSPNDLFERYIYGVLPELGERSAGTQTYEGLLEAVIGAPVETRMERFERRAPAEDMILKSAPGMAALLDRFLGELVRRWLGVADIMYAGRILFTRAEMIAYIERDAAALPLGARLARLEAAIWDAVFQRRESRMEKLRALARSHPRHGEELVVREAQFPRYGWIFSRPAVSLSA